MLKLVINVWIAPAIFYISRAKYSSETEQACCFFIQSWVKPKQSLRGLYVFSRALHWLQDFPRLAPVASFPALSTGCKFSRA